MARDKFESDIVNDILDLLSQEQSGLELNQIIEILDLDEIVSARTVRNILNGLVDEGKLAKQRVRTGSPGKPPYVFMLAEFMPKQLRLLDDTELEVLTRTEVGRGELDTQEKDRLEKGLTALESIARGHIQEDRFAEAIINIAVQIAKESPVELLLNMAEWVVEDINRLAVDLIWMRNNQVDVAEIDSLAGQITHRLQWGKQYFHNFWKLSKSSQDGQIMFLPFDANEVLRGYKATINRIAAREIFRNRVAGNTIISEWEPQIEAPVSAVGTDASVADVSLYHSTGKFMRPDPVAIMTAAAAQITREGGSIIGEYQDFDIFPDALKEYEEYTAAVEGLIISPTMRSILPEEDFKHSRMAAMELRQYTEDLRVVLGQARWRPIGELQNLDISPHRSTLVIRDGRVFPLVHRLGDYENTGLYGQIVRNQIKRFARVIHHTMSGPDGDIVYGAAVKDPQQSWLAPLVFWYAYICQEDTEETLSSDDIYKFPFTDTAVSHLLFLGLANNLENYPNNRLFVTFRAKRRFSDIAMKDNGIPSIKTEDGHQSINEDSEIEWRYFIQQHIESNKHRGNVLPNVRDYNHFIYLCSRVGVSMFYAAPLGAYGMLAQDETEGAGHFLLSRLEVSIHFGDDDHELKGLHGMLSWLAHGGWKFDNAHTPTGFDVGRETRIPILVPDVVVPAHEAVTFARTQIGEEVEDALRQLISEIKRKQA